jgi:RimJ/RimL family protein N-acetyltransferase
MNTMTPVLETERLLLRAHTPQDLPASVAMWSDPAVYRFLGGQQLNEEDCWTRLLRYAGHWAWHGFGYWAIVEKSTSELAGEAGFACYKRDLVAPHRDSPEAGWLLSSRFHGKGYATEAVQAILEWGDLHFGNAPTFCIINPLNTASIRVAEKCGYHEEAHTSYKGRPAIAYLRGA